MKAFRCVSVLFTVEIVLPYLLDLGRTFGQVMSICISSGDNWYPVIIGSKAVNYWSASEFHHPSEVRHLP